MLDCRFEGQDGTIEEVFAANRIKDKGFSFMAIKGGVDMTIAGQRWLKPCVGDVVSLMTFGRVRFQVSLFGVLRPTKRSSPLVSGLWEGQLILRFDNTYSWVKPKSIQYELAKLPEEAAPETGKVDEETEEADVA